MYVHMHVIRIHMWPDLPKGSYAHTVSSLIRISLPFNRYNSRLTVYVKGSTVYFFYWGLIHGPVCRSQVRRWSVNGSNLPGQADSQQGITTRLAGDTLHQCSYILQHVELKTAWIDTIWPYKNFELKESTTLWLPTTPHPPPLWDCLWYWLSCEINNLKWRAFQLAIYWRVHLLNGLGWL